MSQQDEITVEDIRAWQKDAVTKSFMGYVFRKREDADLKIHSALEMDMMEEAARYNAAMHMLEEVLETPDEMVDDLKIDEEEAKSGT